MAFIIKAMELDAGRISNDVYFFSAFVITLNKKRFLRPSKVSRQAFVSIHETEAEVFPMLKIAQVMIIKLKSLNCDFAYEIEEVDVVTPIHIGAIELPVTEVKETK